MLKTQPGVGTVTHKPGARDLQDCRTHPQGREVAWKSHFLAAQPCSALLVGHHIPLPTAEAGPGAEPPEQHASTACTGDWQIPATTVPSTPHTPLGALTLKNLLFVEM